MYSLPYYNLFPLHTSVIFQHDRAAIKATTAIIAKSKTAGQRDMVTLLYIDSATMTLSAMATTPKLRAIPSIHKILTIYMLLSDIKTILTPWQSEQALLCPFSNYLHHNILV